MTKGEYRVGINFNPSHDDVVGALIEKNRFNMARADHKLANRAQDGGKKY